MTVVSELTFQIQPAAKTMCRMITPVESILWKNVAASSPLSKEVLERASSDRITQIAREKNGMLTMAQDGFIKAKNGLTTIEEVLRVTKE